MNELDIYLRAKHDISNQLQLLSIYCELGDYTKVNSIVDNWSDKLQREQRFIQLSWSRFVQTVIHYKLTTEFRFDYQIETSGSGEDDHLITEKFVEWIKQVQGEQILIEIKEADDYLFRFVIDGHPTEYKMSKKRGV
ncbi:hypothetical protein ERX37_01615 [Macrococcus hajekii]|uniref:SpoOB alpha-helical domain-containing protein n=1 Tax=Macrococcus hajekii TaxID=198482 RepID=A0A4R6BMD0_9STAP|nr:Spo0B domain-containing protein [Macrococcus hajekii]TDM02812.1 hypothetical protein ERX37_01615 [Macrococcus hajekii]GGB04100.1 hypothetical protein GCM10007190_10160 [Macrococcus hajekii]